MQCEVRVPRPHWGGGAQSFGPAWGGQTDEEGPTLPGPGGGAEAPHSLQPVTRSGGGGEQWVWQG